MAFYMQIGIHHDRVAVDVHHARFGAADDEFGDTIGGDVDVLVEVFGEQEETHECCVERGERVDDGDIDETVVHARLGGDECIVAVL